MDAKAAARIQALKLSQGWDDLTEALNETVAKRWNRVQADIQVGKPVDQREIDFARGVTYGIRVLLNAPAKAASIYERLNQEDDAA